MMRLDDPVSVSRFENACYGGKALIVLGGDSGKDWEKLRDEIRPDVVLGANGTCFEIDDLDFHLVVENLHMAAGLAQKGSPRYRLVMEIISAEHYAKVRMISYLNWKGVPIVDSKLNAIKIKRMGELGDDYDSQFRRFSFRKYGDGFLAGPMFNYPGALSSPKIKFRVGTVAVQLLHLAGILGVSKVHSIGMDFCFRDTEKHHWYKSGYPLYQPDRFRTDKMFTVYSGLKTQHDWLAGAKWLKSLQWMFERDGLEWQDHSHGLLEMEELWCTNGR